MENIIIGTVILWIVSAVFVTPLANYLLKRKLQGPTYAHLQGIDQSEIDQTSVKGLSTQCYILADVLVLSIAGLLGGLLGYWFIGFSLNAKGWPGLIAFIISSFVGFGLQQ